MRSTAAAGTCMKRKRIIIVCCLHNLFFTNFTFYFFVNLFWALIFLHFLLLLLYASLFLPQSIFTLERRRAHTYTEFVVHHCNALNGLYVYTIHALSQMKCVNVTNWHQYRWHRLKTCIRHAVTISAWFGQQFNYLSFLFCSYFIRTNVMWRLWTRPKTQRFNRWWPTNRHATIVVASNAEYIGFSWINTLELDYHSSGMSILLCN